MNLNENNLKFKVAICGIIILFVTLLLCFVAQERIIERKNSFFEKRGNKYLYLCEYDKAIKEYEKINTQRTSNNKEALKNIYIANAYSLKEDKINFKKYMNLAKKSKNKDAEVLNKIILYEFMDGELESALKYGEEVLKVYPNDKNIMKTMIAIYMSNCKLDKAKGLLKLYKVDKKSAYEMAEYSRILMISGDLYGGLQRLKEAWNIDKDEYKIYDVIAQASVYNKDKIIDNIKKLQKNDPNNVAYKMWLAKIYSLSIDTSKEGEKILLNLKGNKDKDVGKIQINLILASIFENVNKYEESQKVINEIIKDNKKDYRIFYTAAWFYLKNDELNKAMNYCKKSINENPSYLDNYVFLMPEILRKMGKDLLAKTYFRIGIEKEPYNYNLLESMGNFYYYKEKNTEAALQYYKLASTINRDEPELIYNIALLFFNNGKNEEAIKMLDKCIGIRKNLKKYHRTLGTIYLNMGNEKKGIEEIREAYKFDEYDILTLNNAGCYYAIYTNDLHKAYYNLKKAFAGINKNTDKNTENIIKENYTKVKTVIDKIEKGNMTESIKMPDLVLLY